MRLLFISSLYPNSARPHAAPYNRQLIAALAKRAETRVIAPVPWCPGLSAIRRERLPPLEETLDGIRVSHPRVFHTPGLLIHLHWKMYRAGIRAHLRRVAAEFRPDHVMIGFLYPDAAAVAPLCCEQGLSHSVRVNGSDFRIRIGQPRFRGLVLDVLKDAPLIFCPGRALEFDIMGEGIEPGKIAAFDNGVDAGLFRYRPKEEARREMPQVSGFRFQVSGAGAGMVLYVGNLQRVKGTDRLIEAWKIVEGKKPGARLVVIGDGIERRRLERQARSLGFAECVVFPGVRPHDEIALWLNAADCLCLPSRSEGMPNVVLEALASGTPVVATCVGEVPFLVEDGVNGFVVDEGEERRSDRVGVWVCGGMEEFGLIQGLADGILRTLGRDWDREKIAAGMKEYTWDRAAGAILARLQS